MNALRPLSLCLLGFVLCAGVQAARSTQPRVYTQTATISGPADTTQNLTFNKVRKTVRTATLKIRTTYRWSFSSITGVSPSGSVPIDYSNVYTVAGSSVPSAYSVSIPYAPGSVPSAYLYPTTFTVPLDPALLSGRGTLTLPVLVTGAASYDTSLYTVIQSAFFTSDVVLEYTL
ncbi:MAG: hypothetical protein ACKOET_00635 [Verrucomicrobiota bacterium]